MAAKHSAVDDDVDYLFYEAVATKVQSRQAVSTFLDLTHMAFEACVSNFTTNVIVPSEKKCIANVSKKYIATALRVSNRFSELQESAAAASASDAAATRATLEQRASALKTESEHVR